MLRVNNITVPTGFHVPEQEKAPLAIKTGFYSSYIPRNYKDSKTICSRWLGYAQLKSTHKSHVIWFLYFSGSVCKSIHLQEQVIYNGTNSTYFWRGLNFCLSSSPMRQKLEINGTPGRLRARERACGSYYNTWIWDTGTFLALEVGKEA